MKLRVSGIPIFLSLNFYHKIYKLFLFDRSQKDVFAVDRVNESKFSLRLGKRIGRSPISIRIIEVVD